MSELQGLKVNVEKGRVNIIIDVPAVSEIKSADLCAIADVLWYLCRGKHVDACALMYDRQSVNESISATAREKLGT